MSGRIYIGNFIFDRTIDSQPQYLLTQNSGNAALIGVYAQGFDISGSRLDKGLEVGDAVVSVNMDMVQTVFGTSRGRYKDNCIARLLLELPHTVQYSIITCSKVL